MYLTAAELNNKMPAHVISEITEDDGNTVTQAIETAIEEVKSYLKPTYDTEKIFSAEGKERNNLILENTKVVAIWHIISLSNAETIYDMWKDRYDRVIKYLEGVAAGRRTPNLPLLTAGNGDVKIKAKFGSNPKFRHSF